MPRQAKTTSWVSVHFSLRSALEFFGVAQFQKVFLEINQSSFVHDHCLLPKLIITFELRAPTKADCCV
jgi:hypothetical protein